MNFLITGGAGFIGSHIADRLISQKHQVSIIDDFSSGRKENILHLTGAVNLYEGDIRDTRLVNEAVRDVDYIFHQAALSSVPKSIDDPVLTNDINVNGTLNILEAARKFKVKKVIFASSAAVYGDDPELPKNEKMNPMPLSPYAATKLMGEKYCSIYSNLYGLGTVVLRYFNVFGPRQNPNSDYAAVIPKFITMILEDEIPTIYGDGFQSRDFIFIDDVVDSNIKAAVSDSLSGVVMNCAGGNQITINDLAHLINKILDKNLKPTYKDARPGDIKHSYADNSTLKEKLTINSLISIEEGLKKTIESFRHK